MIRMNMIFAASAVVAFLTLGAGAASAMNTSNNNVGHPSSGPSAPSPEGGQQVLRGNGCSVRADQMGLTGQAWQTYFDRCQTGAL